MLTDYTDESEVHQYLPKTVANAQGREIQVFDDDGRIREAACHAPVPADYIKTSEYSGDHEIFGCLGVPLVVESHEIPHPSLGVWALLESFDCPFVDKFDVGIDLIHCLRALYINHYRESCAVLVQTWRFADKPEFDFDNKKTWHEFDKAVMKFKKRIKFDINNSDNWWQIRGMFGMAFNGYGMIPGSGGGGAYLFGAESMGSILSSLGGSGASIKDLLWETPMILLGHATAASARANGVKGVARPKCPQDRRKQLILAMAREHKGELHPWQVDRPLNCSLSRFQREHKTLVAKWDTIVKKAAKDAGIELKGKK